MTGLSLGGYTSALLGAVEDRLAVVIPNAAVTDLPSLIHSWHPASSVLSLALRTSGIPRAELDQRPRSRRRSPMRLWSPKDRRFIVAGLGDRLAPPEQSEWLWEHWDRCRMHWFPGNHVLHVNRVAYLREMREVMEAAAFV